MPKKEGWKQSHRSKQTQPVEVINGVFTPNRKVYLENSVIPISQMLHPPSSQT